MFRSDNDQERATAARLATDIVHASGLTWTRFFLLEGGSTVTHSAKRPPSSATTQGSTRYHVWSGLDAEDTVTRLVALAAHLGAWEQTFVRSLRLIGVMDGLSEGQWVVILKMVAHLKARRLWRPQTPSR